jgi:hypothetical protein
MVAYYTMEYKIYPDIKKNDFSDGFTFLGNGILTHP